MNANGGCGHPARRIHLFGGLPSDTLRRLAASCQVLEPSAGTRLFALGDPPDAVYALASREGRGRVGARSIIAILNQWRADDRIAFDADHGFITLRDIDGLRALTQQDA